MLIRLSVPTSSPLHPNEPTCAQRLYDSYRSTEHPDPLRSSDDLAGAADLCDHPKGETVRTVTTREGTDKAHEETHTWLCVAATAAATAAAAAATTAAFT